MSITVNSVIAQRRDTTESWEYTNPILPDGQLGWEVDIYGNPIGVKMGNGATAWTSLGYWFQGAVAPIVRSITGGVTGNPITIAHPSMVWPSVLCRNSDGSLYGGAQNSVDDGTNIILTGDDDGSGKFIDSFTVIIKQ